MSPPLDGALLKEIAAQIREDNPAPHGSMSAGDRLAAKAIHAFADALEKIGEREASEEPTSKSLSFRIEQDNSIVCPFCAKSIEISDGDLDDVMFEFSVRSHLYKKHPRKYTEYISNRPES